jgi:nucleotide-binding universal stress UspA family protein
MVPPIVIGAHPKRCEPEPIELGLMLARLTGAAIDVVSTFWFDATPQRTASDDYSLALRHEIQQALERSAGDPERAAPEVRIHVGYGPAKYALQETASRFGAGLIVLGSTHRGAVGRIAMGSLTQRVLGGAPCPVAVGPRGFSDKVVAPERVGVAFVDTPGGWAALRAGAAMARHTGAGLIAYTVIESHTHDGDRRGAELAVERAIAEHAEDINSEARVLSDGGVDALVSESRGLDFLVRGCRGHGPVRRPLALGLPSRLARQVACPLVVVPPGVEQRLVALFGARASDQPCSSGAIVSPASLSSSQ